MAQRLIFNYVLEKAIANRQTHHEFFKANPDLVQNLGAKRQQDL
ncbi:hypothetical protein [Helicobacter suis]|nr:hypothetical protein [Helicobacter suis]